MVKHSNVPPGVRLLLGSAETIPFPDEGADFLSMGYALRHVGDLPAAFAEFNRVLRPGGQLCVLEITPPEGQISRALLKAYLGYVAPAIAAAVSRQREMPELMRYYWDTIAACVRPAEIMRAISAAGFVDVDRHVESGVFSEYRARKPG
jgi:demethylmenaquinone methyltransferase/2-methoxy-6-polyprenyl-1,4-benzoquinol methylase